MSFMIQVLIELICNVKTMEEAVKEMKYDTNKAPLGKLRNLAPVCLNSLAGFLPTIIPIWYYKALIKALLLGF